MRALAVCLLAGATVFCSMCTAAQQQGETVVYRVKPSDTDPAIARFNMENVVLFKRTADSQVLFLFMPGTGTDPSNSRRFLDVAVNAGYRVISLAYNDEPAVAQVCIRRPPPGCADLFRRKRIFGDDVTHVIDDLKPESIVNRFVKLLMWLDKTHPDEGWGAYLDGDQPNWSRLAVAGHSQGGGMAAYIAKREPVARVVILSGGWDKGSNGRGSAEWYARSSVTPPEKWFAAFHAREDNAAAIAESYRMMRIPAANIRIINRAPRRMGNEHGSIVGNPANAPDWEFLVGP